VDVHDGLSGGVSAVDADVESVGRGGGGGEDVIPDDVDELAGVCDLLAGELEPVGDVPAWYDEGVPR